jgi:tape measure domain-containing protein
MSLGKIQIDLEARIAKFESDMGRAARVLQRDMVNAQKAVERSNNQMQQTMQRNAARMEAAGRNVATAVGGIFAIRQLATWAGDLGRVADSYSNIQAKVRLAAGENANLAGSLEQVYGVAQRTFNAFDGTAALVQRGSMALQAFGQDATTAFNNSIQLAEIFNKSLVVSGAGVQEATAAAIQFSQALASNKFSGDEFRSVMENNSRFAQLLADSLGVNIAKLREMSKEGKLTTDTFVALLGNTGNLDEQFSRMPLTIGRAKTQLDNAFTKFIGEADQARGASAAIASSISALSRNLGPLIAGLGQLAIVAAGAFAGRSLIAIKAYATGVLEQARATRVAEAATRERAAADAAASAQALLKARAEQVSAEASQRAAVLDRTRIEATIALANSQAAMIRANGLRATSEIELARLSQQLTAVETARAAATTALGTARQREVAINAELAISNRALAAAQTAAGVAGETAAARISFGMRAASIATGAMTLAMRGLSSAVAFLGGPVGLAIIGIGLLASAFSNARAQADQAAASFQSAIQSANDFLDNQSRAGAIQAAGGLIRERAAAQQELDRQKALRSSFSPTGLYLDKTGFKTGSQFDDEIRRGQANVDELTRKLELVNKQIMQNHESWDEAGKSAGATASKFEEQNKKLEEQRAKLELQRIELTKGLRARLEFEAMEEQGVKTAKELDATTRSKIDSIVKEQAAIDGVKTAKKAATRADREAESQKKRDISASYQFAKALSDLSEQMGGELHAAQEQYNQDLAKFEAIAKKGSISAEQMAKAKAMLDERLALTTDTARVGLLGPQAEATLEYERALKRLNDEGKLLGLTQDQIASSERRLADEFARTTKEIERRLEPAAALIEDLEFEMSLLNMSNAARQTAIQLRQLEGQATEAQIASMNRLNQAYEDQQKNVRLMDDIRSSAVDAGVEIVTNFGNAEDAIKSFFDNLQKMITRRIMQNAVDSLFGQQGTNGSGDIGGWLGPLLGSMLGGGAGGSSPGNVQSSGSGYAGAINGLANAYGGSGVSGGSWWSTAISWLGGLFAGGRAEGGPVRANRMYEVTERGPETLSMGGRTFLMTGGQSGHVEPLSGGSSVSQYNQFTFAAPTSTKTQSQVASRTGYELRRAQRFGQ